METGEIDPADLPEPVVAALDGAAGADPAPATPEDWSAAAARDAVLIQETNAALAESNELIAATTRGQRRATRWLQEVNRRQQLRQELQARESADLLARLNTELGEWQNALTTLEERRELLSATEAELETRREALEAIAPPSPDTVAPGTATIESLRLEKGYRAWGADIGPDHTPLEAGLGWAVKLDSGTDFRGRKALEDQREAPLKKMFVAFSVSAPDVVLLGRETIYRDGQRVGWLSSAGYGYTVGRYLGYGYVRNPDGVDENYLRNGRYELEVAGERVAAELALEPFVDPQNRRIRC